MSTATAKTTPLTSEMFGLLFACTVEGQALLLPDDLPRPTYLAFKKIVESIGGKWNPKQKVHLFPDSIDVDRTVADILTSRCFIDPRKNGFFATPDELADRMVALAKIGPSHLCLEPSAGNGVLARRMRTAGARQVMVCELLDGNASGLAHQGFQVASRDFLLYHKIMSGQDLMPFDRIVMNPPFARGQDVVHVTAAWDLLKDDGILVAIVSAGALANGQKPNRDLRELVERWGSAEELPSESFASVGTLVQTNLIVLEKTDRGN